MATREESTTRVSSDHMDPTLTQYGTGAGIALGAGISATAAAVAGVESTLGLIIAFGVGGGLVVGCTAGQYGHESWRASRWGLRVLAVTLFVSLLVGGFLGGLSAWVLDRAVQSGIWAGGAVGGVFSLFVGTAIVLTGRKLLSETGDPDHSAERG